MTALQVAIHNGLIIVLNFGSVLELFSQNMSTKSTTEVLKQLGSYDTPTICNAVELFGLRSQDAGYMNDRIKSLFPDLPPIVGYAATATMRCAAPRKSPRVLSSAVAISREQLRQARGARQAIIAATILGPPKGLSETEI